jgi:hypothetical protein
MEKNVKTKTSIFLIWAPRILTVIYILWLMCFSLDVFSEKSGFKAIALALLMHNIPAIVLIAVLAISWKYEIVGGVVFNLFGAVYMIWMIRNHHHSRVFSSLLAIVVPSFLIGALFLANWVLKKQGQLIKNPKQG